MAGTIASVSGFGIGSLLTPVLAVRVVSADSAQARTRCYARLNLFSPLPITDVMCEWTRKHIKRIKAKK